MTVLFVASMKEACAQRVALVGNEILAHLAGSCCFGFLRVTSSSTLTRSPRVRRATISLLMAALPRTLTLFCRTTAGPGPVMGSGDTAGAVARVLALGAGGATASLPGVDAGSWSSAH